MDIEGDEGNRPKHGNSASNVQNVSYQEGTFPGTRLEEVISPRARPKGKPKYTRMKKAP